MLAFKGVYFEFSELVVGLLALCISIGLIVKLVYFSDTIKVFDDYFEVKNRFMKTPRTIFIRDIDAYFQDTQITMPKNSDVEVVTYSLSLMLINGSAYTVTMPESSLYFDIFAHLTKDKQQAIEKPDVLKSWYIRGGFVQIILGIGIMFYLLYQMIGATGYKEEKGIELTNFDAVLSQKPFINTRGKHNTKYIALKINDLENFKIELNESDIKHMENSPYFLSRKMGGDTLSLSVPESIYNNMNLFKI